MLECFAKLKVDAGEISISVQILVYNFSIYLPSSLKTQSQQVYSVFLSEHPLILPFFEEQGYYLLVPFTYFLKNINIIYCIFTGFFPSSSYYFSYSIWHITPESHKHDGPHSLVFSNEMEWIFKYIKSLSTSIWYTMEGTLRILDSEDIAKIHCKICSFSSGCLKFK